MTRFCQTHVGGRTDEELAARIAELEVRGQAAPLTAGLARELARCYQQLNGWNS